MEIKSNARVEVIETVLESEAGDDARVTGVLLRSGERLEADVVVSNVDLPLSHSLLKGSSYHRRTGADLMSSGEFSAGVIAFYFCIDIPLPLLQHHNVFLATSSQSWERAVVPLDLSSRPPNFYLCAPLRTDPSAAPPGCESIMVLLPVANGQEMERAGQARGYKGLVASGRRAVMDALCQSGVFKGEVRDLERHVINERVVDPNEWSEMYGLAHGAAFGLSHGLNQLAVLRPGQRDPKVKGLYYVGASTRPGNGVPLCMISGGLVACKVAED